MGKKKPRTTPPWKYAVIEILGTLLIRTMRLTWRVNEEPRDHVLALREGRGDGPGLVYAVWHSRTLLSVGIQGGLGVHALVSEHRDGEFIARIMERCGFTTIRGSSTRGGMRALLSAVRVLEKGNDVAFTPDGPQGPRMRVQPGAVFAAHRAGTKIVPVGLECRTAKRLRSWDRFLIPRPFTRVALRFGEPISVPADLVISDEEQVKQVLERVEEGLHAATSRAAQFLGIPVETAAIDPLPPSSG